MIYLKQVTKDIKFFDTVVQPGTIVWLLKLFIDELKDNFRGKQFTYRIESLAPVPQSSLLLWIKRGYEPSETGTAFVKFDGAPKEYTYPAYFWSE